jgi:2-polyprenyl-3-methyl-5-hydroxy-6-metoxy-1,4-benzoquinol methylase
MFEKQIVETGYDQIAEIYANWEKHQRVEERERYTNLILHALPEGAAVLDLGCATGVPTTQILAQRFSVIGVDISERNIQLARQNVPNATFQHADMTMLDLGRERFDGVVAFYSLIHVPRTEHAGMLKRIAASLRPGGVLVATMGAWDQAELVMPWLGTEMYWSFFDAATNRQLVEQAGLQILQAQEETVEEDGNAVTFLWIMAQKPA